MNKRALALAERIEQGADELIQFIKTLNDSEWRIICEPDKRTAGVIAHHVANSYLGELQVVELLAAGRALTDFTDETLDQINAKHAQVNASANQKETIELLHRNSLTAADAVRELSEQQLDSAAPISLNGSAPLTAQFFVEAHLIAHSYHHLNKLKIALGKSEIEGQVSE